ncbi:MAG: hypothetical protein QOF62_983 [Pyrinomonadaceae bacterium]|jgi:hypothetical protein|nr:hypothetical protein [Pyrinomonadaceae bacterium]
MLPLMISEYYELGILCKFSCIERKLTVCFTTLTTAKVYSILSRGAKGSLTKVNLVLSFPCL